MSISRILLREHSIQFANQVQKTMGVSIVLCYLPDNKNHPFVTWSRTYKPDFTIEGDYHGDYFAEYKDAYASYIERIQMNQKLKTA